MDDLTKILEILDSANINATLTTHHDGKVLTLDRPELKEGWYGPTTSFTFDVDTNRLLSVDIVE